MTNKRVNEVEIELEDSVKIGGKDVPMGFTVLETLKSPWYRKPYSKHTIQDIAWKLYVIMKTSYISMNDDLPFIVNCNPKRKNNIIGPYDLWVVMRAMGGNLINTISVDIEDSKTERKISDSLRDALWARKNKPYLESLKEILPLDKVRDIKIVH